MSPVKQILIEVVLIVRVEQHETKALPPIGSQLLDAL
jgi:hypothetical protein